MIRLLLIINLLSNVPIDMWYVDWKKMRFLDFSLFFMFILNSDIIYFFIYLLECNNESFAHIGLIMLFINWE